MHGNFSIWLSTDLSEYKASALMNQDNYNLKWVRTGVANLAWAVPLCSAANQEGTGSIVADKAGSREANQGAQSRKHRIEQQIR